MRQYLLQPGFLFLIMLLPLSVPAAPDARMQVDVVAQDQGVDINWLHANIRKAADMALPQLWSRIIPQHALDQIPEHVKAVRFLQKAVPNEQGVSILFNEQRVLHYLQQKNIPFYAEQSADHTTMEAQIFQSSTVQTRMADSSFPPQQSVSSFADDGIRSLPLAQVPQFTGLLTLQRQASLPEQVLFEEDLAHDPHILSLTLSQVSRNGQQYRLKMKGSNDQWLKQWFRRRGMTLTASVEGWVAQQAAR